MDTGVVHQPQKSKGVAWLGGSGWTLGEAMGPLQPCSLLTPTALTPGFLIQKTRASVSKVLSSAHFLHHIIKMQQEVFF